jgi:hypothetical protein
MHLAATTLPQAGPKRVPQNQGFCIVRDACGLHPWAQETQRLINRLKLELPTANGPHDARRTGTDTCSRARFCENRHPRALPARYRATRRVHSDQAGGLPGQLFKKDVVKVQTRVPLHKQSLPVALLYFITHSAWPRHGAWQTASTIDNYTVDHETHHEFFQVSAPPELVGQSICSGTSGRLQFNPIAAALDA